MTDGEKNKSVATTTESRPRRWDPFAMFSDLEAEMDRMFGRRFPFVSAPLRRMSAAMAHGWSPSADVFEKEGALVVKTELPGVNKDDISVTVENGDLVIKGERKSEEEVKEENFYRMERFSGTFYRRFPLPEGVDESQIGAEYKDGVLEVRVPRPTGVEEAPEAKKITVQ
jgi:HSP20 family protein